MPWWTWWTHGLWCRGGSRRSVRARGGHGVAKGVKVVVLVVVVAIVVVVVVVAVAGRGERAGSGQVVRGVVIAWPRWPWRPQRTRRPWWSCKEGRGSGGPGGRGQVDLVSVVVVENVRAPDRTWGRTTSGRARRRGRSCPRRCRSSPRTQSTWRSVVDEAVATGVVEVVVGVALVVVFAVVVWGRSGRGGRSGRSGSSGRSGRRGWWPR